MKGNKIQSTAKEVLMNLIEKEMNELPYTLGVKDLVELLPHSDTKIYLMLEKGEIPGKKVGGKWVVQRTAFLTWLNAKKIEDKKRVSV